MRAQTDKKISTKPILKDKPEESNLASSRFEVRITKEFREKLAQVALLEGRSMSEVMITATNEALENKIKNRAVVTLSIQAQEDFAAALLNPPKPTEALKKAKEHHKKLFGKKKHD